MMVALNSSHRPQECEQRSGDSVVVLHEIHLVIQEFSYGTQP